MGRKKIDDEKKKIKISISLNKQLYENILSDNFKPSRIIEKLLMGYYDDKKMRKM